MAVGVVRGPRAIALLLLAATATGALAAPVARAADESDLEALRQAILETRQRVGEREREERSLLERLEESDRMSAVLAKQVEQARADAQEAHQRAEIFERQRIAAGERLAATRKAMSRRVVALYKSGHVGPVRFLFASKDMPEMLARAAALETLLGYDADLVARHRDDLETFERLENESRVAARVRDETAATLASRSHELEGERALRRKLLRQVRNDRTKERTLLVELEKAARALEETLAALGDAADQPAPAPAGHGFVARRGHLPRPLRTPIRLGFGKVVDPEFRTETFRTGVEFEAAGGETVRAIAPGVVRFAGWFRGYGRLVIVDHGDDYFSVMGHLAEIFVEVGDSVQEHATLGSVGDTGSLSGPSLYFEIRQGGEALDPQDWLQPGPAVASDG